MQSKRLFLTYSQISRHICTSSAYLNLARESRFLKKLLTGSRKAKTKSHGGNHSGRKSVDLRGMVNPVNKALSVHVVRRMTIRDKVFMEHITDQIAMGEVSDIMSGNIEITHVKITADFKYVNVFWTQSDSSPTTVTKEELKQCARIIRQLLSNLRVIGEVPPIQFVEDKTVAMTKEVNRQLAALDESLKSWSPWSEQDMEAWYMGTSNQTCKSDDAKERIEESGTEEPNVELPVMRHDVLGLDRNKIMSRITSSLSTAKEASQRRLLDTEIARNEISCEQESKVADFLTQEEQKKLFSDFLTKKRIEEKRRQRMMKLNQARLLNDSMEENLEERNHEEYDDCGDNDGFELEDELEKEEHEIALNNNN